jgi:transcriptional antiterminator RfaH
VHCNTERFGQQDESGDSGLRRWFLVLTRPGSEQVARAHLGRQGFQTYLPRLQCTRLRRGRRSQIVVPLFPRYLFVCLESLRQSLGPIRSTRGVASLVRFGERPAEVLHSVVDSIMQRADPATGLHKLESSALRRGAAVSLIGGVFDGLQGIFERETGEERCVILLSLLGRGTSVEVRSDCVAACA